eukprot:1307444-Pyramimonas_sp.AAC.1
MDHPWRSCASPSDVALLSLRGIGWDCKGSTHIVPNLGVEYNLLQFSPMQVRGVVRQGASRESD